MVKRFAIASIAVVLVAVAVILFDSLVAELTGFALPGEMSAALAFFVAFFVGARIGGSQYFWLGILLFVAIQIWSSYVVYSAIRGIESVASGESTVTWVSVLTNSWSSQVLNLVATMAGLIIGGRGVSAKNHQEPGTA